MRNLRNAKLNSCCFEANSLLKFSYVNLKLNNVKRMCPVQGRNI